MQQHKIMWLFWMKLYAIWKLIRSIRVKTKIIIIPSSEGQTRCIALHSTEVHSFTFTTSLNGFRLVYKMLPPLMPEWSFDVPKGSPQIWQVTSLTSNEEGHPLSQPRRVDASLTLTLLRYSELKWYGNLNVEYKFNVDSLDTGSFKWCSVTVVGLLLRWAWRFKWCSGHVGSYTRCECWKRCVLSWCCRCRSGVRITLRVQFQWAKENMKMDTESTRLLLFCLRNKTFTTAFVKCSTRFLGIFNFDMTKPKGVGSTWGSINNVRAVGDFVDGLATERDRYVI